MCGIAGFSVVEPGDMGRLGTLANCLLREIEPRGRDATGLLALSRGSVHLEKNLRPASQFARRRRAFPDTAQSVLLHTRWATVGSKRDPKNAHPVVSGKVAATHNGTIWNDRELFAEIERTRFADVDSEAIAAVIDWAGWDAIEDVMGLTVGGAAVAAIHSEHPDEVALMRTSGYPLVYMVTDDIIVWASTEMAIKRAWKNTYGRIKHGEIITVADWECHRVKAGKVTGIREIDIDPNPPGYGTHGRPVAPQPRTVWVPKKGTSHTVVRNTPKSTPLSSADGRTWRGDLADAEWEQLVMETANRSGEARWSDDGAWEMEGDPESKSLFDMTDEELQAWCDANGFTSDDMDDDDEDDPEQWVGL